MTVAVLFQFIFLSWITTETHVACMMMDSPLEDLVFAVSGDEPTQKKKKKRGKTINTANLLDEYMQSYQT